MSTTIVIVIVVAVVILLVAAVWALMRKRREHQRVEARGIRDRAAEQALEVGQQEARAKETAAKSRAAQAEAEAKAAQAEQLAQQAHVHRGVAADSRTELDKEWERADKVDPASKAGESPHRADPDQPSPPKTGGLA
jgi:FtsZ-interacting cell division protein ZipA